VTSPGLRPMRPDDVAGALEMRGRTRENAVGRDELEAVYGITEASLRAQMSGSLFGWVAEAEGRIVGFAMGDRVTGEVGVVALLPEWEGQGTGRALLRAVMDGLIAAGHRRLWLLANPDPSVRASGFYARQGWRSTGEIQGEDVVLEWRVPDPA
jgi:GNAT superfamily N-acetyltransferase